MRGEGRQLKTVIRRGGVPTRLCAVLESTMEEFDVLEHVELLHGALEHGAEPRRNAPAPNHRFKLTTLASHLLTCTMPTSHLQPKPGRRVHRLALSGSHSVVSSSGGGGIGTQACLARSRTAGELALSRFALDPAIHGLRRRCPWGQRRSAPAASDIRQRISPCLPFVMRKSSKTDSLT